MNESGLPGASGSPPPYLRAPLFHSSSSWIQNPLLLITLGIAAIVLIICGLFIFGGGTGNINGTLVYFAAEPVQGTYAYDFRTGESKPLPLTEEGTVTGASYAPAGERYITTGVKVGMAFVVAGKEGTHAETITSSKTTAFSQPLISDDGIKAAFFSFGDGSKSSASGGPAASLTIASRAGEKYTFHEVSTFFKPIAFSPDGQKLLLQNDKQFSIMTLSDYAWHTLGNFAPATVPSVAVSPNGLMLASADADGVHWGKVDWEANTYSAKGVIKKVSADHLLFTPAGELLMIKDTTISRYKLAGSSARLQSSASISLPGSGVPLVWLNSL